MNSQIWIGLSLLILSIAMFFFGVYVFTYRGEFSQLFSSTGSICFIGWFPTLIVAIIILVLGIVKRQNDKNFSL